MKMNALRRVGYVSTQADEDWDWNAGSMFGYPLKESTVP